MDSLPLAFGKIAPKKIDTSRIDTTKRTTTEDELEPTLVESDLTAGPSRGMQGELEGPKRMPDEENDEEDEDDEEEDKVDTREGSDLPVSHEVCMKDHHKTISALSIDPSGTRVVSGSYDYDAKLWDFSGMNAQFKPFRSWELKEGHQIHDLQFSMSGDSFVAATGSNQPKLYDRNGIELAEFVKGDMYIRDLRHTDGHIAALTSVAWHPKDPSTFISASLDSTIRVWDISNKRKSKNVIVVKSKERGGRTKVTACAWSPDGKYIAAACEDGTLHIWSASSNFARPSASAENAHEKGTTTCSVVFSSDGRHLASRGGDGTVKLWDVKAFKKPLYTATDLPSLNPETNIIFSPDGRYLLTGTAGAHAGVLVGTAEEEKAREAVGAGGGKVVVLRREGLGRVRTLNISAFSVVRVLWNAKINQILTGSSDGSIHVLYSPLNSTRGITLAVTRAPKQRAPDDFSSSTFLDRPIITPHSLPMFKDDYGDGSAGGRSGKRKRERERHDPLKTMKPMPPVVGPGRGGRVGASATQHVVQGLVRDNMRDQDPREALLKYATASVEDNEFTSAWTKTQPKTIFDLRTDPNDEDGIDKSRK